MARPWKEGTFTISPSQRLFSFQRHTCQNGKSLPLCGTRTRRRSSRAAFAKGDIAVTSAHKPLATALRGRIYDSIARPSATHPGAHPEILAEEGVTPTSY